MEAHRSALRQRKYGTERRHYTYIACLDVWHYKVNVIGSTYFWDIELPPGDFFLMKDGQKDDGQTPTY